MPSENEIIMQSPSLTNIFIDNILENSKIDTGGEGNRYHEEVYDTANMVRSNSLKIYEMIKDIFCFPSEKSLDTNFSKSTNDTISFITDINLINEIINQYRKNICNENDVIPAILGVDACSFDRLFHKNKKYAFVFYLQTVNPAYPCLPLHITPHQNGFANCEIIQKIVLINIYYEKPSKINRCRNVWSCCIFLARNISAFWGIFRSLRNFFSFFG